MRITARTTSIPNIPRARPAKKISNLVVQLTGACNLNCKHCYRGGSRAEDEIDESRLKEAFSYMLMKGVRSVIFTGGEPFVRQDKLFNLIEFLKDRMISNDPQQNGIGIESNGTFKNPKEVLERIKDMGNVILRVSFDSFDRGIMEYTRGAGVFEKLMELARISREIGYEYLYFVTHYASGNVYKERKTDAFNTLARLVGTDHIKSCYDILQMGNAARNDYRTSVSKGYDFDDLDPKWHHRKGWCHSVVSPKRLVIRPNGNVGTCCFAAYLPEEYGSLRDSSIVQILNNLESSRLFRLFADGGLKDHIAGIDRDLFPAPFITSCEPTIITTSVALWSLAGASLPEANLNTARDFGYLSIK
ncbi:MAG: radical SAM protein [Candidatus Margulisbacteria bacterium]|nr:radical SAM protein [Candidatus Margulisiibacteriota bacterium]